MQFADWIPALTTTSALSLALWLFRSIIKTRLTASVQHQFDGKLERIKSDLRASEKQLETKLAQRSAEFEALRSGALSGLAQRRFLVDKRRLEAIDQLWGTLVANQRARALALSMSVLNLEEVAAQVEKDERIRILVKSFGAGFDPAKIEYINANLARPYVSAMAWALYNAIQAITGFYAAHWAALSNGIDSRKMIASDVAMKLIVTALPESKEYLEKRGLSASYHLLEKLDTLLLEELNRMAVDHEPDKDSVKQAAEILEQARMLSAETSAASVAPTAGQ